MTATTLTSKSPADIDPVLRGCSFVRDTRSGVEKVVDATGRTLGLGSTPEKACGLAARVRREEILPPEHWNPALAGCHFGIERNENEAMRVVLDKDGQLLGRGFTKQSAAQEATRRVLRLRPVGELSHEDLAQITTVLTVEVVPGRNGRHGATPATLKLVAEHGVPTRVRLIEALGRELQDNGETRHAEVVDARATEILAESAKELVASHLSEAVSFVPLGNGEHLALRRAGGPVRQQCIELLHQRLAEQAEAEASIERDEAEEPVERDQARGG